MGRPHLEADRAGALLAGRAAPKRRRAGRRRPRRPPCLVFIDDAGSDHLAGGEVVRRLRPRYTSGPDRTRDEGDFTVTIQRMDT